MPRGLLEVYVSEERIASFFWIRKWFSVCFLLIVRLKYYDTSRKVAGSIPSEVIEFFFQLI
jgi:hypothetical protein